MSSTMRIAVMHRSGTYLHRAAAQQNELGRILPARDAADTRYRQHRTWIAGDLLHHVQGDRLSPPARNIRHAPNGRPHPAEASRYPGRFR